MSYFTNSQNVRELTPSDFDKIHAGKLKNNNCSFVVFYAPWCPYCKKMKDDWEEFGRKAAFLDVYAFDCDKYKDHYQKIKTDLPHLVQGFPSMVAYKDGEPKESIGTDEAKRNSANFILDGMRICQG